MPKRSSKKKPLDINELAAAIIDSIETESENLSPRKKNPAAVELGRLGGKKGGASRAKKLSAKKRSQIAKKAAKARWAKKKR